MNQIIREQNLESGQRFQLVRGDITREKVDAIVNAANAYLQHGGGVAGAIALKGGSQIQIESDDWVRKHGLVKPESPAYTSGGSLLCRYVIHAVGPVWGEGDEDHQLRAAITGALKLGDRLELTSISFPAISTGVFGFPIARAARINLIVFQDYFRKNSASSLKIARLTLIDREALKVFLRIWDSEFGPSGNTKYTDFSQDYS